MLRRGIAQVFENPQLLFTMLVAIAIIGSFVYIADRFIGIARDAQDRLVNVRVGSLQDAFAPLAAAFIDDPNKLQAYMHGIVKSNPTISEFDIVQKAGSTWQIVDSLEQKQVGTTLLGQDFFLSLAIADPTNSFTTEEVQNGERYFRTARAITDASSSVIAVALTTQSLSEADRAIAASIQTSVIILVVILLLLLFLFFHHARIIDYTALYRRLKEVDELKDDFIGMASHELRTPLTVIRGYISELKGKEIKQGIDMETIVERIDRSAENLNMLVSDMLDVARIEQGRMPLDMKVLDPSIIVREIAEALKMAATKKGLTISCEFTDGIKILADENRIRQIVTNLISNAVKYSDKGVITVSIRSEHDRFILRVSDNGIGMTAEELGKLFGKFNRAAGDRVRQEIGTGLGLWITKQLVEAMSGKISVESIHGVGSHFIVTFPLAKAA
jgi:signal transduction histidine kinase